MAGGGDAGRRMISVGESRGREKKKKNKSEGGGSWRGFLVTGLELKSGAAENNRGKIWSGWVWLFSLGLCLLSFFLFSCQTQQELYSWRTWVG